MSALLEIIQQLFAALIRQWPELIGTFYGVLLGGLATLGTVRWLRAEERRIREEQDKAFLSVLVEHVNREISKNRDTLHRLVEACAQSPVARLELWDWAATIAGSFASQAHDDLYRTGLQRYLQTPFAEKIQAANGIVFDIRNYVRQARAQHIFNATYREDGEALNASLFAEVRERLPKVEAALEEADRMVEPANLPWTETGEPRLPPSKARRRRFFRRGLRRLAGLRKSTTR